jgi:uncharacterized protein (TIGR03435 family)
MLWAGINVPHMLAQSQAEDKGAAKRTFEVASVKPSHSGDNRIMIRNDPGGRFTANNVPLSLLMRLAYKVQLYQITGLPGWASSEKYDIEAKPDSSDFGDMRKLTDAQREAAMDQQRERVRALLADRFKLTFHRETKDFPVYALVVAKGGPKLHETTAPPLPPEAPNPHGPSGPVRGQGMRMMPGELTGNAVRISFLVEALSAPLGRTVIDKTGLNGLYDFTLKWTPDESQGGVFKGPGDGREGADVPPAPDASGPSVFTAIQEQLGLKLESTKGPVEFLVVDHVERPAEN